MAEKRLDIKVAVSALGVEGRSRGHRQPLRRRTSRQSRRGGRRLPRRVEAAGGGDGARRDSSLIGLARGAGAFAAIVGFGQALEGATDGLKEYRKHVEMGGSTSEALGLALAETIPVAGDLAKKMAALRDEIGGPWQDFVRRQAAAFLKNPGHGPIAGAVSTGGVDWKAIGREMRDGLLSDTKNAARKELDEAVAGRSIGPLAGARLGLNRKLEQIEAERQRVRTFPKEEQKAFIEQLDRREKAARMAFENRLFGGNKEMRVKEFRSEMLGEIAEAAAAAGKGDAAERAGIMRDTLKREMELAKLREDPLLSADQRKTVGQLQEQLSAVEKERLANVGRDRLMGGLPPMESTRFLTGVGNPLERTAVKEMKEQTKFLRMMYELFRSMSGNRPAGAIFND